ncbi:hypothetical protein BKA62DRAFT_617976 [Auriculariales sp. MPI-PUGE-AT-0066]|nr:hypothetical protein BKA62DRAFT_617976 [Auriculariales sp. MPI-PUGE-AT-0066]
MLRRVSFAVACSASLASAAAVVVPTIELAPPQGTFGLERRVASLSIEYAHLPIFGGNKTHPNQLTKNLVDALVERTGVAPDVRPGGITVDSSVYDPTLTTDVQLVTSQSGGIYKTVFGPSYFEGLDVFGNSSRITFSVNLGNNTIGFAQAGAKAAVEKIGWKRLYALELGNEADHYSWGSSRPSTWASPDYTSQFLGWTQYLQRNLSLPRNVWVAGGFAEDPTSSAPMTVKSIVREGVLESHAVKLFAHHTYQYSTCDPPRNAIATLEHLVDHKNITAYLDLWKPQIEASHAEGREFVVGEYNSVSCSGKQNVTDVFGQALWLVDTILYGASIGIARLHLHQGATLVFQSGNQANGPGFSWYDLWYPVDSERYGAARAAPSFVSYLLIAEAVGKSDHAKIALVNPPPEGGAPDQVAIYAIWDASALSKIVVLNMAPRTEGAEETVTVDLSKYVGGGHGATVKRMTSVGGLSEKNTTLTTWGGQSFTGGVPVGSLEIETLSETGAVTLQGAEAVLVFLK